MSEGRCSPGSAGWLVSWDRPGLVQPWCSSGKSGSCPRWRDGHLRLLTLRCWAFLRREKRCEEFRDWFLSSESAANPFMYQFSHPVNECNSPFALGAESSCWLLPGVGNFTLGICSWENILERCSKSCLKKKKIKKKFEVCNRLPAIQSKDPKVRLKRKRLCHG